MPSYKNSKSQSKNGGRRKKQTKRKLRRGKKSRKVMRGGAEIITSDELSSQLNSDGVMTEFLKRYFKVQGVTDKQYPGFNEFEKHYNDRFNQGNNDKFGKFDSDELKQRLSLKENQKEYNNMPPSLKLQTAILTLVVKP
jgi:hypothetical protein